MINEAIAKITKEALELNHPFGFFIEEYLTEKCTTNRVAEKLLAEDKSLKAFCEEVIEKARTEAGKNRAGNVGGWGAKDEEFYHQADDYWGLASSGSRPANRDQGRVNVLDLF